MTDDTTAEPEIERGENHLTIRRTFDAPRERVFRAFAYPNELEQWFAPGGLDPEIHALQIEPVGDLSLSFVGEETRTDIEGTYVEVVENERIVHS